MRGAAHIAALAASLVAAASPAWSADDPCAAPAAERPPDLACGEPLDGRPPEKSDGALAVPRAVLWVPRAASRVVFWPVVRVGELIEHNRLPQWYTALLTSDDKLVGIRPELHYSTSFLPTGGLRLFWQRLPGPGSQVSGRFLTAGPSALLGELELRGPDRVGLTLDVTFNRREDRLFAGIGPSTRADLEAQGRGLARYGSEMWRTGLRWRRRLPVYLVANLHGDVDHRDYRSSDVGSGPSVAALYGLPAADCAALGLPAGCVDPAFLPGFARGLRMVHTGGSLTLDRRDDARDGSGVSVTVAATYGHGIAGDPARDVLLSSDTVVAVGGIDRVLILRAQTAMVEPVGAEPVPFDELVTPAGNTGMRGFPDGRFHGSSGMVGTAEYRYYIASSLDATLFSDVGTVAGRGFAGLGDSRWYPSFGVGLRLYSLTGPHWEMAPHSGIQVAYAPDSGVRLLVALAGF